MTSARIYIVECSDGSFYTGLTKQIDPEARVWEHNNRVYQDSYTSFRLPVKLAYAEHGLKVGAAQRRLARGSEIFPTTWRWLRLGRTLRGPHKCGHLRVRIRSGTTQYPANLHSIISRPTTLTPQQAVRTYLMPMR
jgi:predicted GIY-YIG superfamily endonuclease